MPSQTCNIWSTPINSSRSPSNSKSSPTCPFNVQYIKTHLSYTFFLTVSSLICSQTFHRTRKQATSFLDSTSWNSPVEERECPSNGLSLAYRTNLLGSRCARISILKGPQTFLEKATAQIRLGSVPQLCETEPTVKLALTLLCTIEMRRVPCLG
jgi:hypothetical protein